MGREAGVKPFSGGVGWDPNLEFCMDQVRLLSIINIRPLRWHRQ